MSKVCEVTGKRPMVGNNVSLKQQDEDPFVAELAEAPLLGRQPEEVGHAEGVGARVAHHQQARHRQGRLRATKGRHPLKKGR